MDIVFVGGVHRGGIQGKTDKTPVIMAVEIRRQEVRNSKTNKLIKRALAGRVRLLKLPDKSAASVDKFVKECIAPGAVIVSDDGTEFTNLLGLGYDHRPVAMLGDRTKMDSYLPMISRVTANMKTWIDKNRLRPAAGDRAVKSAASPQSAISPQSAVVVHD